MGWNKTLRISKSQPSDAPFFFGSLCSSQSQERIPGSRVLVEMIEKFEGKIVNPPILSFLNGCESHGEDADGEGNDLKRRTDDDDELVDGAEDEDEEVGGREKLSLENEFEEVRNLGF